MRMIGLKHNIHRAFNSFLILLKYKEGMRNGRLHVILELKINIEGNNILQHQKSKRKKTEYNGIFCLLKNFKK